MASADLIKLIDLSLGVDPAGVVNFNYLHSLLHEIVKRLTIMEEYQFGIPSSSVHTIDPRYHGVSQASLHAAGSVPSSGRRHEPGTVAQRESTDGVPAGSEGQLAGEGEGTDGRDGAARDIGGGGHQMGGADEGAEGAAQLGRSYEKTQGASPGQQTSPEGKGQQAAEQTSPSDYKESALSPDKTPGAQQDAKSPESSLQDESPRLGKVLQDWTSPEKKTRRESQQRSSVQDAKMPGRGIGRSTESGPGPSASDLRKHSSRSVHSDSRSRSSIVTAANDLGALERKLQDLELRMSAMESLPDLLDRKAGDSKATPVRDMWNFTNLHMRMSATEDGLGKTSHLVDELLGEVQDLRQHLAVHSSDVTGKVETFEDKLCDAYGNLSSLGEKVDGIEVKLKHVEALKGALSESGSIGEAVSGMLTDLQGKVDSLENEVSGIKDSYVTTSQMDSTSKVVSQHDEDLKRQAIAITQSERSLGTLEALGGRVGTMEEHINKSLKQLKSSLGEKVSASDLASLMPKGTDGGEGVMSTLLEMKTSLSQLESAQKNQPPFPPDFLDQFAAVQKGIDGLSADMSIFSTAGAGEKGWMDALGSEMAQMKERFGEMDRAVTALSNMAALRGGAQGADDIQAANFVDMHTFDAMQNMLAGMQQEHERLMGTAAHLAHELEINKEHVKSLYSTADDLREVKADREAIEVEVKEKADRRALESKASRDWVDSTFERLDKEIREAKSKLVGQEEAFKNAMAQLNEDVEGKLDRLELEPLKEYFDKRIQRVKAPPTTTVQTITETAVDDAAGFKKPLRFRCISCDRPVGVKPLDAVPALPSVEIFPGHRSFRPYTTYELEIIRRHQKTTYIGALDFPSSIRAAGGTHTVTRPHQRIRVAPLSSTLYTPDASNPVSRTSPTVNEEVEIVGQDGHIYKGRTSNSNRSRLPPIVKPSPAPPKRGKSSGSRPSTSPMQQPVC